MLSRIFSKPKISPATVVAENNIYIRAHGSIADIQKAFHVSIHNYTFAGKMYRSNGVDPAIADTCGSFIAAVMGMDDVAVGPAIIGIRPPISRGAVAGIPLAKGMSNVEFHTFR